MTLPTTVTSAANAATAAPAAEGEETLLLQWRVHRLRDEPRGIPLVAASYAAALLLWWWVFPAPLALVLPVFALTGALSDYLFPISYRLTTRGAYADCGASRLFLAWTDVRRATCGTDGVFLSPLSRPSRRDAWRGIRLRYADGNDEQVRSIARDCRDAATAVDAGGTV